VLSLTGELVPDFIEFNASLEIVESYESANGKLHGFLLNKEERDADQSGRYQISVSCRSDYAG
jgi:hypothetical protein